MSKQEPLDLSLPWMVWVLIASLAVIINILLVVYQMSYVVWYITALLALITAICWIGLSLLERYEKQSSGQHTLRQNRKEMRADVLMMIVAIVCLFCGLVKIEDMGLWSPSIFIIFAVCKCFFLFGMIFTVIGSIRSFSNKFRATKRSKQQ